MSSPKIFFIWTLLWLVTPVISLVLFPNVMGDILANALLLLPYPHGTMKWILEGSQGLILHQRPLLYLLFMTMVLSLVVPFLKRHWWVGIGIFFGLGLFAPHYSILGQVFCLCLLTLLWAPTNYLEGYSLRVKKILVWVPILALLFPKQIFESLGQKNHPRITRFILTVMSMVVVLFCFWVDRVSHYDAVRKDLESWPTEMLDERIQQLAISPPGVRADWHGLRIIGDTAIVSCERNPRVSAMSLVDGEIRDFKLKPRWGADFAGPLEAEVNPLTGHVWTVDGGDTLLELKWNEGEWTELRRQALPVSLSFSYITKRQDELLLTTVQASQHGPRRVLKVPLPELTPIRNIRLHNGSIPAPMPREALWVPTINRLVIAPDFGTQLFEVDLSTGQTSPWLDVPTLNGKMIWDSRSERIVLAVPNRFEIWVIDPKGPTIERRLPSQLGVRALAMDTERGLIVSASVLTGQIWVQDILTGRVHLKLGTVYPMVRELALSESLGVGVLTTWNAVYRFDYLP